MAAATGNEQRQLPRGYVLLCGLLLVSVLIGGAVVAGTRNPPPPTDDHQFLLRTEQLQGFRRSGEAPAAGDGYLPALNNKQQQATAAAGGGGAGAGGGRRMLIGSRAPTCTYNECRGCRHRCSIQEVPIDASDPINSAYHHRCICHV